jgi:hypothetical protein
VCVLRFSPRDLRFLPGAGEAGRISGALPARFLPVE